MKAGFSAIDITPPVGGTLDGFIARLSPSVGVDLPLQGRALILETDARRTLLVGLDVLGLAPPFADRLVGALAQDLAIPPGHVVLASSHTHSGPMTAPLRGLGPADESYLQALESPVRRAAAQAASDLEEVEASWGTAPVEIGVNRREIPQGQQKAILGTNPGGPCDRLVRVLRLQSRKRSCVLFEHACHPYCLGAEHPLLSPDFWGHAARALQDAGHDSIYLNGCAGDIRPIMAFQGPDAARETGVKLAEAVLEACRTAEPDQNPILRGASVPIHLPYDTLPPWPQIENSLRQPDRTVRDSEGANPAVQARLQTAGQEWLTDLKHAAQEPDGLAAVCGRLSIVRIGRGVVIALPGEVFFGIGERIARRLHAEPVCMTAYAHGYIGYIPEPQAFAYGGYEVDEAHRYVGLWRVGPQSDSILQDAVLKLWHQLGGAVR